jgi:peptide/nickel transport system permease protein
MLETMGRTTSAPPGEGAAERTGRVKHGLRSALTPIVTIFGLDFGLLIGGAVLTETVFGLPGLGQLAIKATQSNDLPPVLAVVLITASSSRCAT